MTGTRVPAEIVAGRIWAGDSLESTAADFEISIPQALVACWFMASRSGSRTWKKRWGEWADEVFWDLWHQQYGVQFPPSKVVDR